jgi:hypothetical protein
MTTTQRFCHQCGKPLEPDIVFCGYCGARLTPQPPPPAAVSQQPGSTAAYPVPQPPAVTYVPRLPKRAGTNWLLVTLGGVVGACLCVVLVVLVLTFRLPNASLSNLPAVQSTPVVAAQTTAGVPTIENTATPLPTKPSVPVATVPSEATKTTPPTLTPEAAGATVTVQPPAAGGSEPYSDDFSNPKSGWDVVQKNEYELSYTGDSSYFVGVKVPEAYVIVPPPYAFKQPVQNVAVTFLAKTFSSGASVIGAVCDYTSMDNYYWVGISGDQYAMGKMVNGQWTPLTDPYWKKLTGATPADHGFMEIGLSCFNGFIVFNAGGMGQEHLVDTDLSSGDVGLYVESTKDRDGPTYYTQAFFKDFKAELIK